MSDPTPPTGAPPEPPEPPVPPEPPGPPADGEPPPGPPPPANGQRNLMRVLAYMGPLACIPLLVDGLDDETRWHAKNGLVLFVAEILGWIVLGVLAQIPGASCLGCFVVPVIALAILVVHVVAAVRAVNDQRLVVPGVSGFADRF